MAPKRSKRSVVDLTVDDDEDYAQLEPPPPKRRRVNRKQNSTALVIDDDGAPGAGPSRNAPAIPTAGPSMAAAASPPLTGRGKKKAAKSEKDLEQRVDELGRTVKYRPTASMDVQARIGRAMPGSSHRMFLVDTKQLAPPGGEGGPAQEFNVLGATGNVYAVRISRCPHCTCPDFAKGNLCKHILFVMLRVLRQSREDPVIWQRALLTHEVERVLSGLNGAAAGGTVADQSVLASERVRQRYAALVGAAGAAQAGGNGVQRPIEGDCPICYEEMTPPPATGGGARGGGRGGEAIVFCHSCGNNMHKECFERWAASKRASGEITCVYCRAPWQGAGGAAGGGTAGGDTGSPYVNLSQYSDAHREGGPSLEELYGTNAYFIMAGRGDMSRRQALRMHAAARGWS